MCEITEDESLTRRLDSLAAENEVLMVTVDGLRAVDVARKRFLADALAFIEVLKAEIERLESAGQREGGAS